MRYILLILTLLPFGIAAQNCESCTNTLNNYVGSITVNPNDRICLTGTYSGNVTMAGGILSICANAQIANLVYDFPSQVTVNKNAIVRVVKLNGKQNVTLTNYSDSLVMEGGGANKNFELFNYGKCTFNGGSFGNTSSWVNTDSLIINFALTLNGDFSVDNSGYFLINGNFNPRNKIATFRNTCQLRINGDLTVDGQNLNISGGYFRVNKLTLKAGSVVLNDATAFYANELDLDGFMEGVGQRSSIICNLNPRLNKPACVRGNLSLCVKTGTYTPPAGTVQPPASVDCNNPIGKSDCNPEAFGYEYFRMVPQTSTDWSNSATWQMWINNAWTTPPLGRYPRKSSAVLIGDNKQMEVDSNIEVSKLVLGETGSAKIILDPSKGILFKVNDTLNMVQQSSLELNGSEAIVKGQVFSDLNIKGSDRAKLTLDVKNTSLNLKMDQTNPGQSNALFSLSYKVNGTLTLSDSLNISRTLYPMGGTLQTSNKLTLLSNQYGTASVATGSGNYITGNVKVQRYIPSIARRFRFVSATVQNANLLDWQQEMFITGNNAAGNATGNTIGQLNSAGFDFTQSNAPSMYYYNESILANLNQGWVAVTNETPALNVPLPPGKGYRLFIRGDRSDTNRLNGINNTQNEVTLDLNGALITGDVILPVSFSSSGKLEDDGWNLVGNPYACAFDWKAFYTGSGVSNKFDASIWVYDPRINSYVSYNALAGAGSLNNGLIPGGQSFWVKANAATPSMTLTEAYKKTDSLANEARELSATPPHPDDARTDELSLRLVKDSINKDQLIIKYVNGATTTKDPYDIIKYWSSSVGISSFSTVDSIHLDLSSRPVNYEEADFIPVYFFVSTTGTYTLEMKMNKGDLYSSAKAFLVDNYTKRYIDIQKNPVYSFAVNLGDAASLYYNRFHIVYFAAEPSSAEVNYLFGRKTGPGKITVNWGSLKEPFPTTYTVERGYSIHQFTIIDTVAGTGDANTAADYESIDSTADLSSTVYYRIGIQDANNPIHYSTIIEIDANSTGLENATLQEKLTVYPIPTDGFIYIQNKTRAYQGAMHIKITDITGKEKIETLLDDPTPSGTLGMDISRLSAGIYFMELTDVSGQKANIKIVKQ